MNLLKHARHADQVVVEDFFGCIKQLENALVAYGVVDICALFARGDDIPVA